MIGKIKIKILIFCLAQIFFANFCLADTYKISTEGRGGFTEFDATTSGTGYTIKGMVGDPGTGTSTSANYTYFHGTYWFAGIWQTSSTSVNPTPTPTPEPPAPQPPDPGPQPPIVPPIIPPVVPPVVPPVIPPVTIDQALQQLNDLTAPMPGQYTPSIIVSPDFRDLNKKVEVEKQLKNIALQERQRQILEIEKNLPEFLKKIGLAKVAANVIQVAKETGQAVEMTVKKTVEVFAVVLDRAYSYAVNYWQLSLLILAIIIIMSLLRVAENLEKDTESENVSDKNQESSGNEKGANEFATVPKENALSVPSKIEDDLARPQDLDVKRIGSLQEEEEKKFPKQDF